MTMRFTSCRCRPQDSVTAAYTLVATAAMASTAIATALLAKRSRPCGWHAIVRPPLADTVLPQPVAPPVGSDWS